MSEVATDPTWPTWLRDIDAVLSVTPQFVLSGNIRDRYLLPVEDRPIVDSVPEALHAMLLVAGFDTTLVFDPVDGYRVLADAGDDDQPEARPRRGPPPREDQPTARTRA